MHAVFSGTISHCPGATSHGTGDALTVVIFLPSEQDRKSTRLNSSHVKISYAVFCLKKKTKNLNKYQRSSDKACMPLSNEEILNEPVSRNGKIFKINIKPQ